MLGRIAAETIRRQSGRCADRGGAVDDGESVISTHWASAVSSMPVTFGCLTESSRCCRLRLPTLEWLRPPRPPSVRPASRRDPRACRRGRQAAPANQSHRPFWRSARAKAARSIWSSSGSPCRLPFKVTGIGARCGSVCRVAAASASWRCSTTLLWAGERFDCLRELDQVARLGSAPKRASCGLSHDQAEAELRLGSTAERGSRLARVAWRRHHRSTALLPRALHSAVSTVPKSGLLRRAISCAGAMRSRRRQGGPAPFPSATPGRSASGQRQGLS